MQVVLLTRENCPETALDDFIRTQSVENVYRRVHGAYQLVYQPFVDDWTPASKREKAQEMVSDDCTGYGIFSQDRLVAFVLCRNALSEGRLIVDSFHVSQDFRRRGYGRVLFAKAAEHARQRGAHSLYFSACSSEETIAFYRAMGCVDASRPIAALVEEEPFDLQLECPV